MPGRSSDYLSLVAELVEQQDALVEELLAAVAESVDERFRTLVVTECRPHMEVLLPACLRCMLDGASISAAELAPLVQASRRRASLGVPVTVSLSAIRGAIGRFGSVVVHRAGIGRALAVASVLSQAAVFSHDFAQAVSAGRTPLLEPRPAWMDELVPTQRGVLQLAAQGCSTREIAAQLHYSEQNVGYHLGQLMEKMHVRNRAALVARAVQHGLVELPHQEA